MNYRHAYHAGNFADVIKHAVLCRVLTYLREKPAAFRVIDTHAGAGVYDLTASDAGKTGEWRNGIDRLLSAQFDPSTRDLLVPYLDAVGACNPPKRLTTYPGSPALARSFLRRQDRLIACELEPRAAAALARNLHGDIRVKTIAIDGWTALSAYVPPKERRGVVLVDPPFEQPDEIFSQLAKDSENGTANGRLAFTCFGIRSRSLPKSSPHPPPRSFGHRKILRVEFDVGPSVAPTDTPKLQGAGLIVVNLPWTLR
jgi:23S rRNA (adenine2030-N6)-methyltransferase